MRGVRLLCVFPVPALRPDSSGIVLMIFLSPFSTAEAATVLQLAVRQHFLHCAAGFVSKCHPRNPVHELDQSGRINRASSGAVSGKSTGAVEKGSHS